jgi:hypothetical protein
MDKEERFTERRNGLRDKEDGNKSTQKHKKSKHLNKLNILLLLVQKMSVGYVQ